MKVTIKNTDVLEARLALRQIRQHPMPVKVSFAFGKTTKAIEAAFEHIIEERQKLIEQYAEKDENGQPMFTERGVIIFDDKEHGEQAFLDEQAALHEVEQEVEVHALSATQLQAVNVQLPAGVMLAVDFMVTGVKGRDLNVDIEVRELIDASLALQQIRGMPMPVPVSFQFGRAMRAIQKALDPVNEERQAIVDQFAEKDEKGRSKTNPSDGEIIFPDPKAKQDFIASQEILYDRVINLAVPEITVDLLEQHNVSLPPGVLVSAGFLFTGFEDSDAEEEEAA